ncbi:MAG: hypothetical protein Q7S21_03560 [archaeon]|nr:hypothetical protein [archaeon]
MKKRFEKKIEELDEKIIREGKNEKDLIPTCAKCGSTNLTMAQTPAKIYFREIKDFYCRNCGYEGTPVLKKIK